MSRAGARLPRSALALAGAALGALGCLSDVDLDVEAAEFEEPERTPLAVASGWVELPGSRDPLADHRPDPVVCSVAAWGPEGPSLEVQTGACNYFSVAHETLVELTPGDELVLDLWHDDLDASEPAKAHLALLLDGRLLLEARYAIPSEARVHQLRAEITEPAPAGAELVLHLHNHGYNSWSFVELARLR
ncbi:hypothetical protein PPSIR1_20084 [Plesiocystis pacifica SIR-1]|uniref:Lipoprotein n=1 Tax=Plesiocystis pacifica SIR-1 TaxID=391625 RepID=A6GGY2_9BACT|nr:hypothetical protein [Plesiocystis pacifica]EDM74867.1 hypothetical protein PPSIR1_20084 [Plesiocystis pacifica SIR-1]